MKTGIIMPYYNEPELLIKSVNAIVNQLYQGWHLFIVDDGSEKGNRALDVLEMLPSDKITVTYKSNGGVSSARNIAIDLIKADKTISNVAYCDADDVWDNKHLAQQLYPINEGIAQEQGDHKFYDFVYSPVKHQFIDGSTAVPFGIQSYPFFPGLQKLLKGNFIFISSVVHRKECLDVGYFDKTLDSIEDWDYWTRITIDAWRVLQNNTNNGSVTYTVKLKGNAGNSKLDHYRRYYEKHSQYKVNI